MKGIRGYSRPGEHGSIIVDTEGMAVDLITVMKATGHSKAEFLEFITKIFDDVHVEISLPTKGSA